VLSHCSNMGKPGLLVPVLAPRLQSWVPYYVAVQRMDHVQSSFLNLWDEPGMLHELLADRPLV
jgi:hypothetical protein